ncbi:MAG: hypothetical protein WB715_00230 [Roseiarcus sp.]|uniref:hypothetical protein n=1 Tax=Roseiarcus sp. TaxID=1969460 RepID=UPI003C55D440
MSESYLVEIFLPLADNLGRGFPPAKFAEMADHEAPVQRGHGLRSQAGKRKKAGQQ